MLKPEHHSKIFFWSVIAGILLTTSAALAAAEAVEYKKNETGAYKDIFDQAMFSEGTNLLRFDRLYRYVFRKKIRAEDVNIYDEVPDSAFFTNRQGKKRLSAEEIEKGYQENNGPDSSGKFTITHGKFEGSHPGFFIKDARGDEYIFKFDPIDNLELATSAEMIASRFYYAIGYNVPQYTLVDIDPEKLIPSPDATIYDDSGFKKKLTTQRLEEYLLFLPQDESGKFRATATKILAGENKGGFSFDGRRKEDPEDTIDHRNRREIRTLWIFSAWLNNYDVREGNTLDMLVTEKGKTFLKHYLLDFNTSLGCGADGPKAPMISQENMFDYGEVSKAYLALGLWEKPWQKRWRENGEKVGNSPAVGYFDNRRFDAEEFKTQLPYYAFKDTTNADGFWAAKIIMSFSDDDIRAAVKAGRLKSQEDADYIAKTLIERRDLIGRYWFKAANPLDGFLLEGDRLTFKDLSVDYQFENKQSTSYRVDVFEIRGSQRIKIASVPLQEPAMTIDPKWISGDQKIDLYFYTVRTQAVKHNPYVLVSLDRTGIKGVIHQD